LKDEGEMSEEEDEEGENEGREEGRRAAGEDSGGNADDAVDDGVGSREEDAVEGPAQLLCAPQTGRAASLPASIPS